MFETPISSPPPKHRVSNTFRSTLTCFPFPPFLTSFQPPLISLRARRNQGISTLPRENARSLLSHPLSSCSQERASRQAGRQRQTRPDRTSPGRQAGLSHSFLPFPPNERAAELQRRRSTGRSIGLAWLVGGVVPRRPAAARRHDNMIDAPSKWFLLSLSSSPFSPSSPLTLFLDLIRGLRWPHSLEAELAFVGR